MVTASVIVSGTISDFTDDIRRSLRAIVATEAAVPLSAVHLSIAAASVQLSFTIAPASAGGVAAATRALSTRLSDPTSASAFLSTPALAIAVESIPIAPAIVAAPPSQPGVSFDTSFGIQGLSDDNSNAQEMSPIYAAVAASLLGCCLASLCVYRGCKKRSRRRDERADGSGKPLPVPARLPANHSSLGATNGWLELSTSPSKPSGELLAYGEAIDRISLDSLTQLSTARRMSEVDDEAQWEWPSASLQWGERLGKGSFGSVMSVESDGLHLAAKRMVFDEKDRDATVKMMRREGLAMRKLIHPNITQVLGIVLDHPSYIALLMERAQYGSLRDALDDYATLITSRTDVQLRLALDIAEGMAYLHSREPMMLHHDLKSANVLLLAAPHTDQAVHASTHLNDACVGHIQAKLCDFGLVSGVSPGHGATVLQSTIAHAGGAGTLAYSAPEAFSDEYVAASEVYAYGIILWEILTAQVPWAVNAANGKAYTQATLMHAVVSGTRPELSASLASGVLGGLAQRCWHGEAVSRPNFERVRRQLQLGLRQSQELMSGTVGGGHASVYAAAPPPATAPSSPNAAMTARESKLTRTLRQSIFRSHKHGDEDAEVHKTRAGRLTRQFSHGSPSPSKGSGTTPAPPPAKLKLAEEPMPTEPMPTEVDIHETFSAPNGGAAARLSTGTPIDDRRTFVVETTMPPLSRAPGAPLSLEAQLSPTHSSSDRSVVDNVLLSVSRALGVKASTGSENDASMPEETSSTQFV